LVVNKPSGPRIAQHGGSWQGFKAYIIRYIDEEVTVAVLANMSRSNPKEIAYGIAGLVDENLKPKEEKNSN